MLIIILDIAFKITGYSLIMYGLWLLVGERFLTDVIDARYKTLKRRRAIKRLKELNETDETVKKRSRLYEHISLTLSSLNKTNSKSSVNNFFMLTVIILVMSFSFLFTVLEEFFTAAALSLIFATLPYMVLRFLLAKLRSETSAAFYELSTVLLQNYQASSRDIYYTIFNTSKEISDNKMQRLLMKLLSSMQKERTQGDFKQSVRVFAYSINSTAAKRFSKLLEKAHLEDANISQSLSNLQEDIKKRREGIKKEKTDMMETLLMGYLPIVSLGFSFYLVNRSLVGRDIWYYFFQKSNLTLFAISLLLSIVSLMLVILLRKPRTDL